MEGKKERDTRDERSGKEATKKGCEGTEPRLHYVFRKGKPAGWVCNGLAGAPQEMHKLLCLLYRHA